MQDPRGQPLLGMQSQGSPGKFQQESYRQMPQQQGELLPALPPHLHAEQAVAFDRNFGGATLQSYNSSEGSGEAFAVAPALTFTCSHQQQSCIH